MKQLEASVKSEKEAKEAKFQECYPFVCGFLRTSLARLECGPPLQVPPFEPSLAFYL